MTKQDVLENFIIEHGHIVFQSVGDFEDCLKLLKDMDELVDHSKPYSNYKGISVMFSETLYTRDGRGYDRKTNEFVPSFKEVPFKEPV